MNLTSDYSLLNRRFRSYLQKLDIQHGPVGEHVTLKVRHTYRVVNNITQIARREGLSVSDTEMARIIALLHDTGRFEQFIQYQTFDDTVSVNHARLGIDIIQREGFLNGNTSPADRELILNAIMNHNLPQLENTDDNRLLLFSRMIRDADKLDIWDIMTRRNVVHRILEEKENTDYEVPVPILEAFRQGRQVPRNGLKVMSDYRLLRLGWIYDMNFKGTFQLIEKRDYVRRIIDRIQPSASRDEIAAIIQSYVKANA